jgi:hypothetical protein
MICMPSKPMSSWRPTKGEMKVAPGLGGEQRLVGREAQGDVDHRPLAGQRLAGLEAVEGQRHLDGNVVGDPAQHLRLAHHLLVVERHHFRRDGAGHDVANLLYHLEERPPRFVDERGIGGDAVEEAGLGELADFGGVGGVDEEFHVRDPQGKCAFEAISRPARPRHLKTPNTPISTGSPVDCGLARIAASSRPIAR